MLSLSDALPALVPTLTPDLCRYLMASFPHACRGAVEDAAQDALLHLAAAGAHPDSGAAQVWRKDGASGLRRLAYVVAWRALRGQHRRRGSAWVHLPEDLRGGERPDEQLIAAQAARRLPEVLEEAGARFSSRAPEALHLALLDSLTDGEADAVVAARHGLRREPLCRARRWVQERIAA